MSCYNPPINVKRFLGVNTSRGTKSDSGCQTIASPDLISIDRYYLEAEKQRKGGFFCFNVTKG